MNVGNKVKIINIDGMWDNEIYFNGWGLFQKLDNKSNFPNFNEPKFFEIGDEVVINSHSDPYYEGRYMLEIILTDDSGKDFKCHSQGYDINEIEEFCELI